MNPVELKPGATGARITGDDVQFAIAWHAALRTQIPHAGVSAVTIEAMNVGNVDDVVVSMTSGVVEYMQVKAAVTAQKAATPGWLCELSRTGGPSIIQRFYRAWIDLRSKNDLPQLVLITSRSIDPDDLVLTLRDRHDRIDARLRTATTAATRDARDSLINHLDCTEDELFDFLASLRVRTDASEAVWKQHIAEVSYAAGVRADETAFRLGVAEVREWVKTNRVKKTAADVAEAISRLGIHATEPYTILTINALEESDAHPDAAVTLNWVDRFRGTEARNRRGLKDPKEWETLLRPQLAEARRALRDRGARRILITGTMRLPTWFAAGVAFQETAGFTPAKIKEGQVWTVPSGPVEPDSICLSMHPSALGTGRDVALAVAISTDLTADVNHYLTMASQDIPVITVRPSTGTSNASITSPTHAYAIALAVRNLAREIARTNRPPVLHLFLAAPPGLAVLLGSVWDRVPTTQTYEDLRADGYEPAFFIPN